MRSKCYIAGIKRYPANTYRLIIGKALFDYLFVSLYKESLILQKQLFQEKSRSEATSDAAARFSAKILAGSEKRCI